MRKVMTAIQRCQTILRLRSSTLVVIGAVYVSGICGALAQQAPLQLHGTSRPQLIGAITPIVSTEARSCWPVRLEVAIDTEGRVQSAQPLTGPKQLFAEAIGQARSWRFAPYILLGEAIPVKFFMTVPVSPVGRSPSAPVPFPEVKDQSSISITLQREECFGFCPAYKVEISGDGVVTYTGHRFVAATGRFYRSRIKGRAPSAGGSLQKIGLLQFAGQILYLPD